MSAAGGLGWQHRLTHTGPACPMTAVTCAGLCSVSHVQICVTTTSVKTQNCSASTERLCVTYFSRLSILPHPHPVNHCPPCLYNFVLLKTLHQRILQYEPHETRFFTQRDALESQPGGLCHRGPCGRTRVFNPSCTEQHPSGFRCGAGRPHGKLL